MSANNKCEFSRRLTLIPLTLKYCKLLIMPANDRWQLTQCLTLKPLTWKIWWARNTARNWQMGINSTFST